MRTLRIPCRVAVGCTDLSLAWPHGGTGLGSTRNVVLVSRLASYPLTYEAFGGEPVEWIEPGEAWIVAAFLRGWDRDAVDAWEANAAAGGETGRPVVTAPGTVRAGLWATGRGSVLVVTPDGSTHATSASVADAPAPFLVFHHAVPIRRGEVERKWSRSEEHGRPVAWAGVRSSGGKILSEGRREDVAL